MVSIMHQSTWEGNHLISHLHLLGLHLSVETMAILVSLSCSSSCCFFFGPIAGTGWLGSSAIPIIFRITSFVWFLEKLCVLNRLPQVKQRVKSLDSQDVCEKFGLKMRAWDGLQAKDYLTQYSSNCNNFKFKTQFPPKHCYLPH